MIEIKIDDEIYTEEQYKKDFVRYFKTEIGERRKAKLTPEESKKI